MESYFTISRDSGSANRLRGYRVIVDGLKIGHIQEEPVLRTAAIEKGGKIVPFLKAHERIEPDRRRYARSASDDKAGVLGSCLSEYRLNAVLG